MMKLLDYLVLLVFIQISLSAQTTVDDELAKVKSNPDIKVEFLSKDRISVSYSNLKTTIFNLGENLEQKNYVDTVPRFVFNLWELDTSLFNYKYYFWQEIDLGTYSVMKPLIGDVNNNKRVEFYGHKKNFYTDFSEVWCYEQDVNGIFKSIYKYPTNSLMAYNIFDINGDDNLELHLINAYLDSASGYVVYDQTFFKIPSVDSLATQFYFDYNIYTGDGFNIQLNDFTMGDFDNDGINEAIFFNFSPQQIWLVKFDEYELTFDSVLAYPTWYYPGVGNEYVDGFVVGDFDMDRKTDLVYSSEYGHIYVLEKNDINNYSINWEGNSGIRNAYINFKTNDIDKNGKPEFWVGGQNFAKGLTRIICFETNGDNHYHSVAEIEFPGLLSLNGLRGMSMDVDNDSNAEIFVNVGNTVVLLKFIGMPNNHNYEVYYYHLFENVVQSVKMFNFPDEKFPGIVLSLFQPQNGYRRDITQIFKHYLTVDVTVENIVVSGYNLLSNYPNPFNPSTKIKFTVPERSEVKIKVYNSIGEEIITLINRSLERGEHTIVWNGRDKNNFSVPSGIYFISMKAGSFQQTIKSVLIK